MKFLHLIKRDLLIYNKSLFIAFICIPMFYFAIWNYYFYYDEDLFTATYGEQISYERILFMITNTKKFIWINLLFLPVVILLRVSYSSFAMAIGGFFTEMKIDFAIFFNISLKAEIVVILMYFTKWIFIEFIWDIRTLNDLSVIPFSLNHLLAKSNPPLWSTAALSYVSIWEILYMLVISLFLGYYNKKSILKNLAFTLSTYGVALLFWIVVLTYVAITLT